MKTCFVLLLLGALAFAGFCVFLDIYGQQDRARPAQAIVVLGARVLENQEPGDSLRARTRRAVALYQQGMAPKILCTGGVGENPPSEAFVAQQLAVQLGVPEVDTVLETESDSTFTNARNAAKICREYGWTRVIVVSDPYHLWRVRRNFAHFKLTAYPSPARECRRNREWPLRAQWTAREAAIILRDLLMGR